MNMAYKKLAALGLVTAVGLFVPSMPGLAQINTESQRAEVKTIDASYFLDLANAALSARDYQNAIFHANKAVQLEPDLPQIYLIRARAQEELGQYQGAIEDLYAAAQLYEEENNLEGEAIARQMILDIR